MARQKNRDRGLYERVKGSGDWHVEWYDHTGQRRRQKVGDKEAARNYREEVLATVKLVKRGQLDEQILVENGYLSEEDLKPDDEPAVFTFEDYLEECYPELEELKSWKDVQRYASKWVKIIGDLALTDPEILNHAKRHREARRKKVSDATCNREIEFLRGILSRAVREGRLEKNPLSLLKDLKETSSIIRYLTEQEEDRLAAVVQPEDFEIIALAMDTGIRREKTFSLPWAQVSLDRGWIKVVGAKAGSDREIPMTARVRDILERRKATVKSHFVFPNLSNENHLNPENFVRRVFKPALKAAQIENFRWHDLRHTFVSRLVMRGVPLATVRDLAGHKDFKTTLRYAHLAPENFEAAIATLNEKRTHLRAVK